MTSASEQNLNVVGRQVALQTTQEQISPFANPMVPDEIKLHIFSGLSASEAAIASLVCREWHNLLNDCSLWHLFLRRDYKPFETENPKELYQRCLLTSGNFAKGIFSTKMIPIHASPSLFCITAEKLVFGSFCYEALVFNLKTLQVDKTLIPRVPLTKHSAFLSAKEGQVIIADGFKIEVWDVETGSCTKTLQDRQVSVFSLCFTTDGCLASGEEDGTVRIWDLKEGVCKKSFKGHQLAVHSLCLTKEGDLISGDRDGQIKIWDLAEGICKKTLTCQKPGFHSLRLMNDGKLLAIGLNGVFEVLDMENNVRVRSISAEMVGTTCGYLTESGKLIAVCNRSFSIKIFNLETGDCENTLVINKQDNFRFVTFTSEQKLLLVADDGRYGMVYLLDFAASNRDVFEELASQFETNPENTKVLIDRFSRMPERERGQIYVELYKILKESGFSGSAAHAFHDLEGFSCPPQEKAQAIRNYLNRKSK